MARIYVYALLTVLLFGSVNPKPVEKTVDDLLAMIQTLENKMTVLDQKDQKEIAMLKSDNDHMQERIAALEIKTKQLELDNAALPEQVQEIMAWMNDRQMDADSMFLATISATTISIDSGDPIIWDTAPINPGGHFSTVLGAYEAPVDGYYQFSVNKQGHDYNGSFFLLVDEVRFAHKDSWFPDTNATPSGSATINVELTAGQIVRVQNIGSTAVLGTDSTGYLYSWFTGHLLYTL